MKNKILLIIAPALAAAGWYAMAAGNPKTTDVPAAEAPAGSSVAWGTDYAAARERARAENKLVLLDFTGSDWCPPCMMLERSVFSTAEFAEYAARHLVPVKIDFPRFKRLPEEQQAANDELARQYWIRGYPTIIVLSPDGRPLGQLGYRPGGPQPFIAELEKLRAAAK